ncbi:hypothetical protein [Streptomyces capitiformicae]|uniref:Uncharacterized protein n=1 Tax=Streptomyces capitiformicae TaxID=2014920 RepID=A0A918ZML3_9ACTN|nr:hypothetical protein [Streptomyces capitiformicae]GHE60334.1 hypothetical protein GCM10017771_83560 [Streptomyces capitiformicae]
MSGTDPDQVPHQVAATVRALAEADLVAVAVAFEGGDELVIEAADGEGADRVRGLVLLTTTTPTAKVYHSNERITGDALSREPQEGGGSAAHVELALGSCFRWVAASTPAESCRSPTCPAARSSPTPPYP